MSFLVVRPDGTEENFDSLEDVFAAETARCSSHLFEPVRANAQVVTNSDNLNLTDFEGCVLCGVMRRKDRAAE